MIKTLIKLKILKFILIGGASAACVLKRYCDQKNQIKSKKDKKTFGMTVPEFYERLSKYKRKDLKKILPSKTLKIQDIFS